MKPGRRAAGAQYATFLGCTAFNSTLVQPGRAVEQDGPDTDDEGGDGAAMLDGEDGPPVAVGAPEDAYTAKDIVLLLEAAYGAETVYWVACDSR